MTFGQTIKSARIAKHLTQRDLANILGVHFTYLSKIENNRTDIPPSERLIRRLAQVLEIDVTTLLSQSGRRMSVPSGRMEHLNDIISRVLDGRHTPPDYPGFVIIHKQDFDDLSAWFVDHLDAQEKPQ